MDAIDTTDQNINLKMIVPMLWYIKLDVSELQFNLMLNIQKLQPQNQRTQSSFEQHASYELQTICRACPQVLYTTRIMTHLDGLSVSAKAPQHYGGAAGGEATQLS